MRDIKSMTPEELREAVSRLGEPKYRGDQIFAWLSAGAEDFGEMTNLPAALWAKLKENFFITRPEIEKKQVSARDGTIKYLFGMGDGNSVETVIMRYKHGNTACISTQVGCRMGCSFCASAHGGLVRNLEPSEMLDQVLFSEKDSGLKISNIVLMGIGEPLDNLDNVVRFLEIIGDKGGRGTGMRHISLSTCGPREKIDKLCAYHLQLTLSVSLHAPDDETRSRIMPVNRACGVRELIESCRRYFEKTGRRISYEYALIDGVNDSEEQAGLLANLLRGQPGHVNLIPLNRVEGSALLPSRRLGEFKSELERRGVRVTVRRRTGGDIEASCGQLRKNMRVSHEPAAGIEEKGPGREKNVREMWDLE